MLVNGFSDTISLWKVSLEQYRHFQQKSFQKRDFLSYFSVKL